MARNNPDAITFRHLPLLGEHVFSARLDADPGRASYARDKRVAEIRKLADKGDAPAQFVIARFAESATNYPMAIYWFLKAADKGNPPAQFSLATLYLTGRGVPKDQSVAVGWYRKAAEKGLAEA